MVEKNDPVVIVGAARTALGSLQGDLSTFSAPALGAAALQSAIQRSGVNGERVDEVIMGCVLPAGQGQAPARQAALQAGLPVGTGCTTVNKMCGSGMKATMLGHDLIQAGTAEVIAAGGMESMSNAPYLLKKARHGYRLGHGELIDHMFLDGLEDAYQTGKLMGAFAEECATRFGFTRQAQDEYAVSSLTRALKATDTGHFNSEITPLVVKQRGTETTITRDEQPQRSSPEKIAALKPAFRSDGTITAANASSISDGAAALVLMRRSRAEAFGLTPLAEILGHASFAHEPPWFTTAPIYAVKALLDRLGWNADDPDLYEINEAFAVVTMAAIEELGLSKDRVNIHGGACALGHPIGASGARIIVTLMAALQRYDLDTGVASLCIGGGEATALAIKRIK